MKRSPFVGALIFFLFLVAVELLCRSALVDTRFFPSPSASFGRLFELLNGADGFFDHLRASFVRYGWGVALSVGFAMPLAAFAGLSPTFRSVLNSMLGMFYPLPKSAIFPFFLLVFGLSNAAHIALIVSGCLTLILTSLISGCARLESSGYFALARTLRLTAWKRLRYVLVPGLRPEFLQGLKLGTSYALVLLIVGEMVATQFGVGVFLWSSWDRFRILDLYAVLYLVSFAGVVLFGLFEALAQLAPESHQGL